MGIASETISPQHMQSEKEKWTLWAIMSAAIGLLSFFLIGSIMPLVWWAVDQPLNVTTWGYVLQYLDRIFVPNFTIAAHDALWRDSWMNGLMALFTSLLSSMFIAGFVYAMCPYLPMDMIHGDVRWATDRDIRKMEQRKQIGIEGGYLGVLGRWKDGRYIRLIEPISVACSAPPGTGKTAALVVPSIIESPNVSMIVNDPKPELAQMTSGYRAEIGFVFILDWSATDKPEEGIFYPRFNFLSRDNVPPKGTAQRDTYLDAVAKVLIPESKSGDKYFVDKGRDALTGYMHYLVSKVNDEPSNYDGIPEEWHGKEASFPMMVDWLASAQFEYERKAQQIKQEAMREGRFSDADGMKMFLTGLIDEIKTNGYSARSFTSIMPLVNMAERERSGIIGTVDQALLPFKNASVKERTSSSDFVAADLRGMRCPVTNEWLPVTLYICVNQAEAGAFASITTLLYEVLSREFQSYGPGETNKMGRTMGPMTICFMLDEFAKLPKSEKVLEGPDLGRSKKVSYWLFFQSRSQIIKTYSKEDGTIIDSTCGVNIVLSQNDHETAKHYSQMVGKTTTKKSSLSRQTGFSKQANPFAQSESYSIEGVDFLRTEDITAMEPGTHIILPQNFLNRPIKCESPFFFQDEAMMKKVYNPRTGQGPAMAQPLPEHIRRKRMEEWLRERERIDRISLENQKTTVGKLAEVGTV